MERSHTAVSSNSTSPRNSGIEFSIGDDPFEKSRKKGVRFWILHHLFHKRNKYLIIFWVIFIGIVAIWFNQVKVVIGDAVDVLSGIGIGETDKLLNYFWLVLGLGVAYPLLNTLANFLREILAQRIERDVRDEFYLNLLGKSQSFHDAQRIGDIMARATNDVRQLNFLISPALSLLFDAVLNMVVPVVMIALYYPPQLLIAPVLFIILFGITLKQYVDKLGPITTDLQIQFGNVNAILNESLSGIEIVKGLTQEKRTLRKYRKAAEKYMDLGIKQGIIQARYIPILIIAFTITLSLGHGVYLQQQDLISVGNIISYIGLIITFRFPTHISIWTFAIVKRANAGSKRLLDIMNETTEIDQIEHPISRKIEGNISFNNVSFRYPGQNSNNILENISIDINQGQTIAIVGTTGSGKTTLTKLISRLYDVNSGEILIDGINIKKYDLRSLREQIAYIEQDLFLFSNSIAENIAFGQVSSKERIVQAAKDAQAHDFIEKLPKQYDSEVGQRGVQLSGGERQRIAIARAFISDPKILVLDDSTSAIDSRTEEKIQRAIARILEGRTTFIITHRLSQIRWADKILVLRRGRIIAQGTHSDLLKTSEEYRKIFVRRFDKTLNELLCETSEELTN